MKDAKPPRKQPPRDWVSHAAGLGAAAVVLAGLGYAFAGPAARLAAKPVAEVWVTLLGPPAATAKPRPH